MSRFVLMFAAVMLAFSFPAMAETRIGVVDLRQALFSSDDAKTFSESLQKDFAGDEARVREAQEEARKLQEQDPTGGDRKRQKGAPIERIEGAFPAAASEPIENRSLAASSSADPGFLKAQTHQYSSAQDKDIPENPVPLGARPARIDGNVGVYYHGTSPHLLPYILGEGFRPSIGAGAQNLMAHYGVPVPPNHDLTNV